MRGLSYLSSVTTCLKFSGAQCDMNAVKFTTSHYLLKNNNGLLIAMFIVLLW